MSRPASLPRALLRSLVALAAAAALTSCGGKDDADAIRDTIRSSLTSSDPDDCASDGTTTDAFRRQYALGSAALAQQYEKLCRANARKLASTSVKVAGVNIEGDQARASFSARGGQYAFARASVQLRKDDDRWRLDRLTAVKLEREAYDAQQVSVASGGQLGFSREAQACFTRRLKLVSDSTLERAIVKSDPVAFADPLLVCFIRPELREFGLSNERTRCVIRRLRRDARELTQTALVATKASEGELQDLVVRAATTCAD